jgi:predicted enzyme related to lactoylglutathione lyase
LNLTVADIGRSIEFYQRVLGMKTESMGEAGGTYLASRDPSRRRRGVMAMSGEKRMPAHICSITETPIGEVAAHLETRGVPVRMQGPRAGAVGTSTGSISTIRIRTRSRFPPLSRATDDRMYLVPVAD